MEPLDYARAVARLSSLNRFGREPGHHRMAALLAALQQPQERLQKVIHIAGTNGKGSVAAMLVSGLHGAGLSAARFTSPHLLHYGERFHFNGENLSSAAFADALANLWPAVEEVGRRLGEGPTQFEVLTALMYYMAARRRVPWLVQETGLGGRLDATNLLSQTTLTIITSLDLDHTRQLGSTLAAVAAEKAGILRPNSPLVTTARGEAWPVIKAAAQKLNVPLHRVWPLNRKHEKTVPGPREGMQGQPTTWWYEVLSTGAKGTTFQLYSPWGRRQIYRVPLAGRHQGENGAAAVAALKILARDDDNLAASFRKGTLQRGLARVNWPGRLTLLPGSPPVVVDGAHNPGAMAALTDSLHRLFPRRPVILLCAFHREKDLPGMVAVWSRDCMLDVKTAIGVPLPGGLSWSPQEVAAAFQAAGLTAQAQANPVAGWSTALQLARGGGLNGMGAKVGGLPFKPRVGAEPLIVVTGSLHLAGWALDAVPAERGLNCTGS